MRPPAVVAAAAYGTNAHPRVGLADRGIDYVLAIRTDMTAYPLQEQPVAPARNGPIGCWPQPRYRHPAPSVAGLAAGLGQEAFTTVAWRTGSRGGLRSRFAALRIRPAGKAVVRPIRAAASGGRAGGTGSCRTAGCLSNGPKKPRLPPRLRAVEPAGRRGDR